MSLDISVDSDGFLQMLVEMCGKDPMQVSNLKEVAYACIDAGQPVLAYLALHYYANRKVLTKSSIFLIPRQEIPKIYAGCVFTSEDLKMIRDKLVSKGYPEPETEKIPIAPPPQPSPDGRAETPVPPEVPVESISAYIFVTVENKFYPILFIHTPRGHHIEVPMDEIATELAKMCMDRLPKKS